MLAHIMPCGSEVTKTYSGVSFVSQEHFMVTTLSERALLMAKAAVSTALLIVALGIYTSDREELIAEAHTITGAYLVAQHSGKCISIGGSAIHNGAPAIQFQCGDYIDQRVSIEDAGSGYHRIVFTHSGKCLTVQGGYTWDGAILDQWTCLGQSNQKWSGTFSNGVYYPHASQLNPTKCITVSGGSTANGAQIDQWQCLGQSNQNWQTAGQLSHAATPYSAFGPYSYKAGGCSQWSDPIGTVFVYGSGNLQQPLDHAEELNHGAWNWGGAPFGFQEPVQNFNDSGSGCSNFDGQASQNSGVCEGRYHMRWEYASTVSLGHVYAATPHRDILTLQFPGTQFPCGHCLNSNAFTDGRTQLATWWINGAGHSNAWQSWWGNTAIRYDGCNGQQVSGNGWVDYIDIRGS
jgi:hypothetical protein